MQILNGYMQNKMYITGLRHHIVETSIFPSIRQILLDLKPLASLLLNISMAVYIRKSLHELLLSLLEFAWCHFR